MVAKGFGVAPPDARPFVFFATLAATGFICGCSALPRTATSPPASYGATSDSPIFRLDGSPAVDAQRLLYIANANVASVTEYRFDASGDVAPVREIFGSHTHLDRGIGGIAVDSKGLIYVSRSRGGIVVFAPGARGNATPLRTIERATDGPIDGFELAVDASDNLYVADNADIKVFAPGAHGTAKPLRDISGPATTIGQVQGVAVDATGVLYAVDFANVDVLEFAPGASGNVAPIATISGPATTLAFPRFVGASPDGGIYVSDESEVQQFAPGARGNVAPVRRITFPAGDGPYGNVAFGGSVVFLGEYLNRNRWSVGVFRPGAMGGSNPVRTIAGQKTKLSEPVGAAIR